MDCKRTEDELLVDYLYGELDPAQRAEFETHLAGCPACRGQVAELRSVLALVRAGVKEEPPQAVSDRILHAARTAVEYGREQRTAPRRGWLRWLAHPLTVSAILAVVVVSVGLVSFLASQSTGPGLAPDQPVMQKLEAVSVGAPAAKREQAPVVAEEKRAVDQTDRAALNEDEPADDRSDNKPTASALSARPDEAKDLAPAEGGADAPGDPRREVALAGGKAKQAKKRRSKNPAQVRPRGAAGRMAGEFKERGTDDQKDRPGLDGLDSLATRRGQAGPAAARTPVRGSGLGGASISAKEDPKAGLSADPERPTARFAQPPPKPADGAGKAEDKKTDQAFAPVADALAEAPAPPAAATRSRPKKRPAAAKAAEESLPADRESGGDADLDLAAPAPAPMRKAAAQPQAEMQSMAQSGAIAAEPDEQRQAAAAIDPLTLADRAFAQQDYPRAATLFRQFLAQRPGSARAIRARYGLARALFLNGQCREAATAAEGALAAAPDHPRAADTLFDLASCQIRLGRFERATATYRRIEQQHPGRAAEARRERDRIERPSVEAAPASRD